MSDPFACGLAPEDDYALTGLLAEDPKAIETINLWVYDDANRTGVNLHPSLKGGEMSSVGLIFLPDGRILRNYDPPVSFNRPERPASEHQAFECIEPFRRWRPTATEMPVFVTSAEELHAGLLPPRTPDAKVSVELEVTAAAPIWLMGTLLPESREEFLGPPGLWIAGRISSGLSPAARRYDQAVTAEGTVTFEGRTYPFKGAGLRGHVRGVRIMDGMNFGHTWMGAVFGNGDAFGVLCMPREGGGYAFSEAYVYKDGRFYPNRVRFASPQARDSKVSATVVELVCDELGLTRIEGEDIQTFWWPLSSYSGQAQVNSTEGSKFGRLGYGVDPTAPIQLRQGVARYRMGDQVGLGMDERSGP